MQEIIKLIPVLGTSIIINIALGLYYKIGTQNTTFDYKILLSGIIKAIIIGGSFVGLAYCFDTIDLTSIGITPLLIMGLAITLYVTKDLENLSKILGVTISKRTQAIKEK